MIHLGRWARRFRAAHTRRGVFVLATLGLSLALVAALVGVGQTLATPASPSITLSPSEAVAGTAVTVDGARFNCKSVDLAFDGTSVGTASPTKKAFSATITVPSSVTVGQHKVTASCAGHKGAAQATFTVLSPSADLAVQMTGPTSLAGETRAGDCSVSVANLGPDPASNVVVRVRTDPGLRFVLGSISAGSYDPGAMQWTIGSMLPNAEEHLTCVMVVDTWVTAFSFFNAIATASSDTADPNFANNAAGLITTYAP